MVWLVWMIADDVQVRPGHYLTCHSFGHIETSQYWDIEYPDKVGSEIRLTNSQQLLIDQ